MIRQRRLALVAVFAVAGTLEAAAVAEIALRWSVAAADPLGASVELTGVDADAVAKLATRNTTSADWQRLLVVRAEQGEQGAKDVPPPMAGTYRTLVDGVQFTPMFRLAPGVTYIATAHQAQIPGCAANAAPINANHRVAPAPAGAPTVVTYVFPTADALPENLLKFYVHFSAPMSRGGIYEHVRLLDAAGKPVEIPFLELDEELWNPAMTRLTLFIDPGRIKRGVRPLEEIGPALVSGERFRLVIDRTCRDAAGKPLATAFEKAFVTGPPEREPVDPAKWTVTAPESGGRAPLLVAFQRPMDHAITQCALRVKDRLGNTVEGRVELESNECVWKFVPAVPWVAGKYEIIVPTAIEDLAGNNIGKAFEVDLQEGDTGQVRAPATDVVKLSFEVR